MSQNNQVNFDILVDSKSAISSLKNFSKSVDAHIGKSMKAFEALDDKIDKISASLKSMSAKNNLNKFNRDVGKSVTALDKLEKKIEKMNRLSLKSKSVKASSSFGRGSSRGRNPFMMGGAGMMGGLGAYGLISMLSGMGDSGIKFESTMVDIEGILGKAGDGFEGLEAKIRSVGETSAFTINEMAGAAKFMAMAGLNGGSISSSLGAVSNLGMVGGLSVDRSADIITNIMTSMGIDPSKNNNTSRVSDVITATMTSSNVSIEQIGQSMRYVGNIAAQTGMDIKETTAAIGTMGNSGIQASQAGTNMRQMLLRLAAPTKKGSAMIEKLGLDLYKVGDNGKLALRPLSKILDQFRDSGAGLQEFQEIFNVRGGTAFSALVTGAEKYKEILKEIQVSGGLTENLAEKKRSTTSGKLFLLKSKWESFSITLMDKVRPALNYVIDGITKVIGKLMSNEKFLLGVERAANLVANSLKIVYNVLKWLFNFVMDNHVIVLKALAGIAAIMGSIFIKGIAMSLANPFTGFIVGAAALTVLLSEIDGKLNKNDSGVVNRMHLMQKGASKALFGGGRDGRDENNDGTISIWEIAKGTGSRLGSSIKDIWMAGASGEDFKEYANNRPEEKGKSLAEKIMSGEWIKNLMKGFGTQGFDPKKLTDILDFESSIESNLSKFMGGEDGDESIADKMASTSPLTSSANELSRSIIVNIHDGLMHVENQYIGSNGGELQLDDIEQQMSETLIKVVKDYELGVANG